MGRQIIRQGAPKRVVRDRGRRVVIRAPSPTRTVITRNFALNFIGAGGGLGRAPSVIWDPSSDFGAPDNANTFSDFGLAFDAFMALPPGSDFLIASSGTVPPNPADLDGIWDFQNRARYFGGATAARVPFAVADGAVIRNATSVGRLSLNLTTSDESRPVFDYTGGRVVTLEDCSVLAIFVTNRPLFLDAGGGINELNVRDSLAFSFLASPLIVNNDASPLTTRIEGATSGLATTDFSGSGGLTLFYLGSSVQTPDAVSAGPGDFPFVSGAVTVNKDVAVSSFANDAGYMGDASWVRLTMQYLTQTDIDTIPGLGDVVLFTYAWRADAYRLYPDAEDPTLEAFYEDYDMGTQALTGLIDTQAGG